jgi:hypothetical protein
MKVALFFGYCYLLCQGIGKILGILEMKIFFEAKFFPKNVLGQICVSAKLPVSIGHLQCRFKDGSIRPNHCEAITTSAQSSIRLCRIYTKFFFARIMKNTDRHNNQFSP